MDRIFALVRKMPRQIILPIVLGGYILFEMLQMIADGSIGSVGSLFGFIVLVSLSAALIVAVFIRNEKAVNVLGVLLFVYFFLGMLLGFLPGMVDMLGSSFWAYIVAGIFFLFAFLGLVGSLVLFVIGLFAPIGGKPVIRLISGILMVVFLCASVLGLLFFFIGAIINEAQWGTYMGIIAELFILFGIFYGYFQTPAGDK